MSRYQWREGIPRPKVEADVFAAEVERIALETGGIVPPAAIVAAAEKHGSPLAPLFEFDDAVAAQKHRVAQARQYLGALQVVRVEVQHGPALSTRAYHRVSQKDRAGYATESMVLGDRDLKKQVVASAARELQAFINRFQGIAAMGNFVPRLQAVMDEMRDSVDRLELDASSRRPQAVRTEPDPAQAAA